MDKDTLDQVRRELTSDEGDREKPYDDKTGRTLDVLPSGGKATIGIGWNLSDNGLPADIREDLFRRSVQGAERTAKRLFPDFESYSRNRRAALVNMLFNLGDGRFLGFRKMIRAILTGDWALASYEAAHSKWATRDVQHERSSRIIRQLRDG